jgi:hypothetical protein
MINFAKITTFWQNVGKPLKTPDFGGSGGLKTPFLDILAPIRP